MKSVTVYLVGSSGVGKYTISKEISKYGFKLIDNHLITNPILALIDLSEGYKVEQSVWDYIGEIRTTVLNFISNDKESNFVFTNSLLDKDPSDYAVYYEIEANALKRNSLFIPVKINIELEEHKKRISNPERKQRFKSTHPRDMSSKDEIIKIEHPNLLELDVTNLTAEAAAKQIMDHVKKVQHS
jgi:hypothetical protein